MTACIYLLYTHNIVFLCSLINEKLSLILESNNDVYNCANENQYYIDPLCGMLLSLLTGLLTTIVETCERLNKTQATQASGDHADNQTNGLVNGDATELKRENHSHPKGDAKRKVKSSKSPLPAGISLSNLFERLQDVINYTICCGIVDKISQFCNHLCTCIDSNPTLALFLENCVNFLNALTSCRIFVLAHSKDNSALLESAIVASEMFGTMSMLYGTLLHQDAPPRDTNFAPSFALPKSTIGVIHATLSLLNTVANLQLKLFQVTKLH